MNHQEKIDVIIIGGGPAGLSAAILLGRCMRKVVVCDSGDANAVLNPSTSGFIGHDGSPPGEFLRIGREELSKFDTVSYQRTDVIGVERRGVDFVVECGNGKSYAARVILIATDFVSRPPDISGAGAFIGKSLHQCPYCDAWEHRGGRLGVFGCEPTAVDLAVELLRWSPQVSLFINGGDLRGPRCERRLKESNIQVVHGTVVALEGTGGKLELVRMQDTSSHPCDALFFSAPRKYIPSIAARLGFDLKYPYQTETPNVSGQTGVQGLFVAANTFKSGELAIIAAAEGIRVGEAINNWLTQADRSYLGAQQFTYI